MSGLSSVQWQALRSLPEDDRAGILQPAAQPTPNEPSPAPPVAAAIAPAQARSAAEAVRAINALPLPTQDDLRGLDAQTAQSLYQSRVVEFNKTRGGEAQSALERLTPKRDGAGNADNHYAQTLAEFDKDPYVVELKRIVDECRQPAAQLPAYLERAQGAQAPLGQDALAGLQPDAMKQALDALGVDLPPDPTPAQIAAGYELLATVPRDLLAYAINPGMSVSYAGEVGAPMPSAGGVRPQVQLAVEGKVELSDVQTGVGFQQTQQFKASVQMQGETGVEAGKAGPLHGLHRWSERLGLVSEGAQRLIADSPRLQRAMREEKLAGSYTDFAGARLSYEATVTPAQGQRLDQGDLAALPNPLDPLGMPEGTSVLMRGQQLKGHEFEFNYRYYGGGKESRTELEGAGFGVRKLEGALVEVYAGPIKTAENASYLGLGKVGTASVGLSMENSAETRSLHSARIDLSTQEGRDAYQAFMSAGKVPDWNPPGVQRSGKTEVFNAEDAKRLGIELGPMSLALGGNSQVTLTRNTWQDGSADWQASYQSAGGMATELKCRIGADGKEAPGSSQWTLTLADTDPTLARYFNAAFDPKQLGRQFEHRQHLQMQFSDDQLLDLRERARQAVVADGGADGEQRLRDLDAGRGVLGPGDVIEKIAVADTPDEVFATISSNGDTGHVAPALLAIVRAGDDAPLLGGFTMKQAG
ncbi:hypothetical protein RDV84_09715 [Lysobacter yananisis]|uniref:Uncharacterized protein n=1 Tax=Lysobacter yananisis TaxID=1003114 RepID=A0ABY9PEA3_9GAMM|nr:hypothetical protein [Lysobacter yananisis]WMT05100.1 hypothetical protein RDV84_09715 [Lysobacter yananisis]